MPLYLVKKDGENIGLVRAVSSSAAIRIATEGGYTAETVKNAEDVIDILASGVRQIEEKPAVIAPAAPNEPTPTEAEDEDETETQETEAAN
jgi:hypothetical protein